MESQEPLVYGGSDLKSAANLDNNTSVPPPSYSKKEDSPFALVSFHTLDRIRLMRLSEPEVTKIRDCIVTNWTPGVIHCKPYGDSTEFKAKEYLWGGSSSGNPKITKLIQALLIELYEMGWSVEQSVVLCKKSEQKDTLLLRRVSQPRPSATWFSITFDQYDLITLHSVPSDTCQRLIARLQAQDLVSQSAYIEDRVEIKLKKTYWMAQGEDTMKARLVLLEIAEALDHFGFKIYATLKLGAANDQLFCMRENREILD